MLEASYSLSNFSGSSNIGTPNQIGEYSRDINNNTTLDDSQLKYYRFANGKYTCPKGLDLTANLEKLEEHKYLNFPDLQGTLAGIVKYEKEHKKKVSAEIITNRGLLKSFMMLPYEKNKECLKINIVVFDGQLFLQADIDHHLETEKSIHDFERSHKYFAYSIFKFVTVATVPKPLEKCTWRDAACRNSVNVNKTECYCSVTENTIGDTSVILGAVVDCIYDSKPSTNGVPDYVKIKVTPVLKPQNRNATFKNKMLNTWAQCVIVGVPRIVFCFRNDKLQVDSLTEFKTEEIPMILQEMNPTENRPEMCVKFLSGLLSWIKDSIPLGDEQTTYRLTFDPESDGSSISLTENSAEKSEQLLSAFKPAGDGGMLTEEFKECREELKSMSS